MGGECVLPGEPEQRRSDEHVLDHRLELPRPHGGDHHASPFREEAECRDEELAPDEEQRHPHGQAAPPRDPVVDENRGVPREPEDRDERGEQERSEEHTSELQSHSDLVCRLLLEKKKKKRKNVIQTTESNNRKMRINI